MKMYKVSMCDKGQPNWVNILPVEVEDNEHPRKKAVKLLCEMGYMRIAEYIKIISIKRIR